MLLCRIGMEQWRYGDELVVSRKTGGSYGVSVVGEMSSERDALCALKNLQ